MIMFLKLIKQAEKIIIKEVLSKAYPSYKITAEESGSNAYKIRIRMVC